MFVSTLSFWLVVSAILIGLACFVYYLKYLRQPAEESVPDGVRGAPEGRDFSLPPSPTPLAPHNVVLAEPLRDCAIISYIEKDHERQPVSGLAGDPRAQGGIGYEESV